MVRLRSPGSAQVLCDQGLFRAASALQVLSGFGKVFAEGLTGIIGASEASNASSQLVASAGDSAFHGTERVNHVEVFISHTWGSARWPKYLSMCFILNLGLATKATAIAWLLVVSWLYIFQVPILCGNEYLFPVLTELPLLVFFLFFFFGQHFSMGWFAPRFWLDKLCIHQTNQSVKAQQVAALPVFVARSAEMLVLWDDTYFERLWCNMEMATFAKYSGSPQSMKFLPLWLPSWLLSSILLDLLGVNFLRCMEESPGLEGAIKKCIKLGDVLFGASEEVHDFFHAFLEVFPYFVCYLPVALPTILSFRNKIQGHRLMLEQMASFDLRNAKCSVETDRPLVEEQVALHFKPEIDTEIIVAGASGPDPEAVEAESSKEAALERFNSYVQGPLRANVLDCIGDTRDVPLPLCYLCFLPMSTYFAVSVSPVAFQGCDISPESMGFSNKWHMMASFGIGWLFAQLLAYPVTFPVLLRLLHKVEQISDLAWVQLLLGLVSSCFAYAYGFFCSSVLWGCAIAASKRLTLAWVTGYLLVLGFMILQLWFFFGPRQSLGASSCRCLEYRGGEDSKPILGLRCAGDGE